MKKHEAPGFSVSNCLENKYKYSRYRGFHHCFSPPKLLCSALGGLGRLTTDVASSPGFVDLPPILGALREAARKPGQESLCFEGRKPTGRALGQHFPSIAEIPQPPLRRALRTRLARWPARTLAVTGDGKWTQTSWKIQRK